MAQCESLPSHVLSHVLSILPPSEALRFACVNRSGAAAAALLQGLSLEVPTPLGLQDTSIKTLEPSLSSRPCMHP